MKFTFLIGKSTRKKWAYFGKGKMKHNFLKMSFLLAPVQLLFSSSDYRQPFIVVNSEIRFSLTSFLLIFESAEVPQQAEWNNQIRCKKLIKYLKCRSEVWE